MLERSAYPAGVPCWVDTAQPDVDAAVDFYSGLFGWQFENAMPPDAPGRYLIGCLRGGRVAAVGSMQAGAQHTPVWNTYVCVDSADETAAKVVPARGTILTAPMDVGEAGRMAVLADPSGAALCLWQPGTTVGAQLVNEPGTWNWSDLNTRDIAQAKAFYAQIFGWEADPVDFGFGESYMLRVPGYGDFLEQHNPGVRQAHMDAGAPEGFTDAIGWLQLMSSDQFPADAPPRWAVTFSVDDADWSAERAQKLGGTITVPPFDVPYARISVVTDPQGAVFTISKYNPPT
jgi:predicted enzyme related to lactoylglutathione lyase